MAKSNASQNTDDGFTDTIWLLEQWARWSRINPSPSLRLPSITPYRRLLGSTLPSPVISDEMAMQVDGAVARLVQRDSETGHALVLYYFNGGNVSGVARNLRKPRWRVDVLIRAGTSWLDGALHEKTKNERK